MADVSPALINWLEKSLAQSVVKTELIQPLWNNYGQCFRAFFSPQVSPLIAKAVIPPDKQSHPRGWNTKASDLRKKRSFVIEHEFYATLQPNLPKSNCYTPSAISREVDGEAMLLVLEDLNKSGFPRRANVLSPANCSTVLRWLANFHAENLNKYYERLWPTGCYWHLATRQDELASMPDGPLKANAKALDQQLNECQFFTVVHGDAKLANFCFSEDMTRCAAVDFQYVGKGPGIKDVAYFLGSALSDEAQLIHTDECLEQYFAFLKHALSNKLDACQYQQLEHEWRSLYSVACADFHRFLVGWSPQHKKINETLNKYTSHALASL